VNELDEIMSGDSVAAPEIQQEPQANQPRDEGGRFAPKPGDAPVAEVAPAAVEQPAITEEQPHSGGNVPVGAVQDERQKRQAAQQRADDLEKQLAVLQGQVTMLSQQRQPAPQPQQEQQPASLWDDPDAYLKTQLNPVQQQMMEMKEFMSENLAVQTHGAETVTAAKQAIEQAARTPEGQQVIQKMMQSRHPFDELVKWHKQQAAISRVGSDPDAWFQAEYEKRLADPAEQAKILERIRTGAASNTNRSQPVTSLPPSLSRLPAGGNQPQDTDMSDGALFSHATR
jgi:hypothetical protein